MGIAEGAPKDDLGYTCPVCGTKGLAAGEMAQAWSAEGYMPIDCLERQARAQMHPSLRNDRDR